MFCVLKEADGGLFLLQMYLLDCSDHIFVICPPIRTRIIFIRLYILLFFFYTSTKLMCILECLFTAYGITLIQFRMQFVVSVLNDFI